MNCIYSRKPLALLITFALCYCSCKKSDAVLSSSADILAYSIPGSNPSINIDPTNKTINIQFPDSFTNAGNISAAFTLSAGAQASIDNTMQQSAVTQNSFFNDLYYTVTAADHTTKKNWAVIATNNNYSHEWGLGNFVLNQADNNRNYEWYLDQANTGNFSSVNCGPTSVTMAMKWSDPSFSKTPQDARNLFESSGGWWYTNDIDNYLTINQTPHAIIPLSDNAQQTQKILARQLDAGRILILCVDMSYIRYQPSNIMHVDKFYNATATGWGHFFVVKGYQQMKDEFFFDIYDPYDFGLTNSDGSIKGKDRFYRYDDIFTATYSWWDYAFVIAKSGETLDIGTLQKAVDPTKIKHVHGL